MKFKLAILLLTNNQVKMDFESSKQLHGNEMYLSLQTAFDQLKQKNLSVLINIMFSSVEVLKDHQEVMTGLKKALNQIDKERQSEENQPYKNSA